MEGSRISRRVWRILKGVLSLIVTLWAWEAPGQESGPGQAQGTAGDATPPELVITAPRLSILVNETSPEIRFQYADGESGVDVASLVVELDGNDVTGSCALHADTATCESPSLEEGTHRLQARIRDRAGNEATSGLDFQILLGPGPHTVVIRSIRDTYLRGHLPNRNFGTEDFLRVRRPGTNRALVDLDQAELSEIVGTGSVESATLRLHVDSVGSNWGPNGRTVDVHRITTPWTELGATWSCPDDPVPDQHADCAPLWDGGDFDPTPTATVLHSNELSGWVDYDVTDDVRARLQSTPGYGWLIKKTDEDRQGWVRYDSREATSSHPPSLVVVFRVSEPDSTPPEVFLLEPVFDLLYEDRLRVVVEYRDSGTGIDTESFSLKLDGEEIASTCTVGVQTAICDDVPFSPGPHSLRAEVSDGAGNSTFEERNLERLVDETPPVVAIDLPFGPRFVNGPPGYVVYSYVDSESGIDRDLARAFLDQEEITASCSFGPDHGGCTLEVLDDGTHTLRIEIADQVGNVGVASAALEIVSNLREPTITFITPQDGELLGSATVLVSGTVEDDNPIASVAVNGMPATVANGAFSVEISLSEGSHQIVAEAEDAFFKRTLESIRVEVDTLPPDLRILAPSPGALTNEPFARVRGRAFDWNGLSLLTVNGAPVAMEYDLFEAQVAIEEGENVIQVVAIDSVGNESTETVQIVRRSPPRISITAPLSGSLVLENDVEVRGVLSELGLSVEVNGISASVVGTMFMAPGVVLHPGRNVIMARAQKPGGLSSASSVVLIREGSTPRLHFDWPVDGQVVYDDTVSVTGLVNDVVSGTVTASEVSVTINGTEVPVRNRTFLLEDYQLQVGDNLLEAVARDSAGHEGRATIRVLRQTPETLHLRIVGGNNQSGGVGETLPDPLEIELRDASGDTVEGAQVTFEILGSDGVLDQNLRRTQKVTDSAGRAQVELTLGSRAGLGNHRVEVAAEGVDPVRLLASATPGPPALIFADTGQRQSDVTGQRLSDPLVVAVTDERFNRLAGVPVLFEVLDGGGSLSNGLPEETILTDSGGQARAYLTLGEEPGLGNNVVAVTIEGLETSPIATFEASGLAVGDPSETSVSGVVLDNADIPVPGVTVRLKSTSLSTRTDAAGTFRIPQAPIGLLDVIVDGTTADRPGTWPVLDFPLVSVAGRENSFGRPFYLLPLDVAGGRYVTETTGAIVRLADVPGLALEVLPGSVTFPDGGKRGVVSITSVHSDKIPMTPGFGQQPRLVITIQPAGAIFEPPARLTLPNVDGLSPGAVTEMYSFDHDLGAFASIGPATVNEDGSLIQSNPGVGILKAGWHCGGNPAPAGTPHNCPQCQVCDGSRCVPGCPLPPPAASETADVALDAMFAPATGECPCDDRNPCTIETCDDGDCQVVGMATIKSVAGEVEGEKRHSGIFAHNEELEFMARVETEHCTPTVKFAFGEGAVINGSLCDQQGDVYSFCGSWSYSRPGMFEPEIRAECEECPNARGEDTLEVDLYRLAVVLETAGDTTISTDAKYTEDTPVRIKAVRERDGSLIEDFSGVIEIDDETGTYDHNVDKGAKLPRQVSLVNGEAVIVAKSLAPAIDEGEKRVPPPDARLVSTSAPLYNDQELRIQQWVDLENLDPGRSPGGSLGYDWFEARMRDIFEAAVGDDAIMLSSVTGYEGATFGDSRSGEAVGAIGGTSTIRIDPHKAPFREDGPVSYPCDFSGTHGFTQSVIHEGRHAYQWFLTNSEELGEDDGGIGRRNDDDVDYLVDIVPISPSNIIIDSTAERTVCVRDPSGSHTELGAYKGDGEKDSYEGPDWVSRAIEMDAYSYASDQ